MMGVLAKIGADVKRSDIVIAHRVGRFQQGRYQPIIVRFTSKIHKNKVIYQHCKLKGIGIDISNDLTTKNMAYLKKHQVDERVSAAWTKDTKCFVKLKHNDKVLREEPVVFLNDRISDSDSDKDEV